MINITGLTKIYAGKRVVDSLTLEIPKGEIFGLLGPNGAGKSTAIRMLCSIIKADEGEAKIAGFDLFTQQLEIKKRIGYMSQNFGLYEELTVLENIRFYASLYGRYDKKQINELLKTYQIDQYTNYQAGKLSGGYKQRLSLACALIHDPEIIFLDEPTAGIDPLTRKELWDLFFKLSAMGKTLFVTTHYMEEASRCNRVAFLNHGKLVALGTPQALKSSFRDTTAYAFKGDFDLKMIDKLKKSKGVVLVNQFGDIVKILIDKKLTLTELQNLIKPYTKKHTITKTEITLEDAFIILTQERHR
jgi:ABC-2 type transport system ATP-binding protein